jgi:hypothetical protein
MKVKDLIAELQKIDPNIDVFCYTEDEIALAQGHGFRLFDIGNIEVAHGIIRCSDFDNITTLKFERGLDSLKFALIEITSDF